MNTHTARVLLVVSCLLAVAAVVQDFRFDQSSRRERTRLLSVERDTGTLLASLAELRAGQMAYLATGQGPDFWMRRVTELSGQIETGLTRLRDTAATAPQARTALAEGAVALGDLMQIDGRARAAISSDQRFLASDMIFADALTSTQKLADALSAARRVERDVTDARLQRQAYMRLALMPVALLLVVLAGYNAGRQQRKPLRTQAEEVAQMIRELPPPVRTSPASTGAATSSATPAMGVTRPATAALSAAAASPSTGPVTTAAASSPSPVPTPVPGPPPVSATPPPAPGPTVSLADMAELCVDLGRVMDARDIPSLLERAAHTLDARGVILWVVDQDGRTLAPAVAHGYSDRVLAKMGTLDADDDNVTSLAYRSMRPQSMTAGGDRPSSAVAVPLLTTAGCNGVLAAEVPGTHSVADCLAVARILSAQFATMVSPADASSSRAAEA